MPGTGWRSASARRRPAETAPAMHLLAAQPGTIADGAAAVDLAQSPAEIVILSAADSEIACLAAAQRQLVHAIPDWPSLRLANLMRLGHNYSVDLYAERMIAPARLVIARVLGGRRHLAFRRGPAASPC